MKPARRVLVVEDDPRIALLLLDYLRSEGFEAHRPGRRPTGAV